jgi:hypothetical protein
MILPLYCLVRPRFSRQFAFAALLRSQLFEAQNIFSERSKVPTEPRFEMRKTQRY